MTDKITRAVAAMAAGALASQIFKGFVWAAYAISCAVHGMPLPTIAW